MDGNAPERSATRITSKRYQVAVCGAGPAGLATALLLHDLGHRVTLFDRLDAPAPIGSGLLLQPTGLAVLRRMGLDAAIRRLGQPVSRLFGRALPSNRVVLDVRYDALGPRAHALAVHRHALFSTLHDAVAARDIPISARTEITGTNLAADGRRGLLLRTGRRLGPFDFIVDAMGVRSPLALDADGGRDRTLPFGALWATLDWPAACGFDPHTLEQRYRRAARMVGVLPIGRMVPTGEEKLAFFWSLAHRDHRAWMENGLDAWKEEVAALWPQTTPLLDQIASPAQLTLARYAHRTLPSLAAPGLVHVGDAAHAASPQLGQGANMALLDAYALARALEANPGDISAALAGFVRLRRGHIRLYQALTWLFTPVYQSDGWLIPALRDRLLGPVSRVPPAPRLLPLLVAGLLGAPLKRLGLDDG